MIYGQKLPKTAIVLRRRELQSLSENSHSCAEKKYYISRTSQPSSQIHPDKGGSETLEYF